MHFEIRHRAAEAGREAAPDAAHVWRTCLREIAFSEHGSSALQASDGDRFADAEAYALLLEIICGLRSPILGETQVMGQFRVFLAGLTGPDDHWLRDIGTQLLADARRVRERHLRGAGAGSYGAAVRRLLDGCEAVAVIGRGALASEIAPYLADCGDVHLWSRDDVADASARPLVAAPAALVVAAPIDNAPIEAVAARYRDLRHVVDLRAESERAPLAFPRVTTLAVLFESARGAAATGAVRADAARAAIRDLAQSFMTRRVCRPFGWEDLCA